MGKIRLLLYCTKSRYRLFYDYIDNKYKYGLDGKKDKFNAFNGKIVAECDFEVEEIRLTKGLYLDEEYITNKLREKEVLKYSCLSYREFADYVGSKGYAIHIKNLNIFDKARELREYAMLKEGFFTTIKNAPQNMMKAYRYDYEKAKLGNYILISIRPEWLCKILNGEKTIEVRKKVLKEMITDA